MVYGTYAEYQGTITKDDIRIVTAIAIIVPVAITTATCVLLLLLLQSVFFNILILISLPNEINHTNNCHFLLIRVKV
jgi:hypothetical protein